MSSVLLLNILWQVSVLALVTFGLAIIFGQLRVMNMAHGEFVMIGAYSAIITAQLGLPPFLQIFVCVSVSALWALIIEYTIIRHLYGRIFDSLLATWAIGILMREIMIAIFGRSFQNIKTPIAGSVEIFGVSYPAYRVILMGCIFTFFIAFALWYRRSQIGVRIRAMVANPSLAGAIGMDVPMMSRFVFVFGCVTTSIAGWLIAPTTRVDPFMGIDYLVRSFFALVIGGLGSLEGLLLGSALIAGLQSWLSVLLTPVASYVIILALSILFLLRRPHGLINKN